MIKLEIEYEIYHPDEFMPQDKYEKETDTQRFTTTDEALAYVNFMATLKNRTIKNWNATTEGDYE